MSESQYYTLNTPPSSDEDVPQDGFEEESAADISCYERFVEVEAEEEEDDGVDAPSDAAAGNPYEPQSPETPRKLVRTHATVGVKQPRMQQKRVRMEEEDNEDDIPDLGAYFALFSLSELEQVKLCRAYANYLSSKTPTNRLRYSGKTSASWNKRKQ